MNIDDNLYSLQQAAEILRVAAAQMIQLVGNQRWFKIEDIERIASKIEAERQRELLIKGKAGL